MHIVAGLDVALRQVLGAHAPVGRRPGSASVLAAVGTAGRDRDHHARRYGAIDADRMHGEDPARGFPGAAGWVFVQAGHVLPAGAAVVAHEQAGRVDSGEQARTVGRPGQAPDRVERAGMPAGRMMRCLIEALPAEAAVHAAIEVRSPHIVAGRGEQLLWPARRHRHLQHRMPWQLWSFHSPRRIVAIASSREQALVGADEQLYAGTALRAGASHFSSSLGISSTRLHGRVR